MRKITIILSTAICLIMASCSLNYFPSDEINSSILFAEEDGAEYIVDGCYALLKEEVAHLGSASGNNYIGHFFRMTEFASDNTCLSGRTTDPLYEAACYKCISILKNVGSMWWISYKTIYTANGVIEGFKEGESTHIDQLIGEAYFLRALMHFNLVALYAKPYVLGRNNLGVVLRTSTNTSETHRATVGEVYDQIVLDLQKAASLMNEPRGNAGYATKLTALALLTRTYLYMEENQKVIDTMQEMLTGDDPASKLDNNYETYFANALSSKETLFAVAITQLESTGQASIASMYVNDGMGWGEVYASDPLLNLYERYPSDIRRSYIRPIYAPSGKDVVIFPIPSEADDFRSNLTFEIAKDAQGCYFTDAGKTYRVEEKLVNGEYTEYYVNYNGTECPARMMKAMVSRNTYPNYYVLKFSYQDGDPMLSSPVFLRWAEVILNGAEAYAKLEQDNKALELVNVIRTRAQIPAEGMFSTSQMHGYTSTLDIVLDERRLELAFEGHRTFDVFRNKRSLDRRFAGVQPWEVIDYTDDKIQYPIPYEETSVSGIPQNPGY